MNELLKNKNYFYFVITYYKEKLQKKKFKSIYRLREYPQISLPDLFTYN